MTSGSIPGFARQQQQFFQFVAEVVLAAHAVEGDRGQRVDGAERARVAAERGFDAEDSQDHLGRDAELRFGAGKIFRVERPEARARGDQGRRQEFRAITRVRTRRRRSRARRRADQPHGRRRVANVTQDPLEVRAVDAVLFSHRIDERAHVRAREVIRAASAGCTTSRHAATGTTTLFSLLRVSLGALGENRSGLKLSRCAPAVGDRFHTTQSGERMRSGSAQNSTLPADVYPPFRAPFILTLIRPPSTNEDSNN